MNQIDGDLEFLELSDLVDEIVGDKKKENRKRNREYGLEEMEHLSDYDFRAILRVPRDSFDELLERISPFMYTPNEMHARNSSLFVEN